MMEKVSLEEFKKLSKEIHYASFNEHRPSDLETFDYAMVCYNDRNKITAYSTIIEHDAESAYMQHGGTFPDIAKFEVVKSYLLMVKFLKEKYKYISTRIYNDNIAMLKLAFTGGFLIHGIEYMKETADNAGGILLCLSQEVN